MRTLKQAIVAAAFTLVFVAPALGQSVGEKTGVNSALGIAPKTEDFIKEAATSDMREVEAAKSLSRKEMQTKRSSLSR